jgi:hypothetical protein
MTENQLDGWYYSLSLSDVDEIIDAADPADLVVFLPDDLQEQIIRAYSVFGFDPSAPVGLGGADEFVSFGGLSKKFLSEKAKEQVRDQFGRWRDQVADIGTKVSKKTGEVAEVRAKLPGRLGGKKNRDISPDDVQRAGAKIGQGPDVPRTEDHDKPNIESKQDLLDRFSKPLNEVGDLIREGVAEENWAKAAEDTVEVAEGLLAERLLPRFKNHKVVKVLQKHVDMGKEAQIRLAVWFQVHENHKKVLEKLAMWAEEYAGGAKDVTVRENPGSLGGVFTALGLGNPFVDPVDTVKRTGQLVGSVISLAGKAKGYFSVKQDVGQLELAQDEVGRDSAEGAGKVSAKGSR